MDDDLERVLRRVDGWEPTTVAVAVVDVDGVRARHGPDQQPLRWASITKILTAMLVLRLVEDGTLALDEPAGPHGATVRHLLAHAGGMPGLDGGGGGPPGRRRVYSNAGYELLGELVAARTGRPYPELLRTLVLDPLGLHATRCDGSPAHGCVGPLVDLARLAQACLRRELLSPTSWREATTVQFPGLDGVLPGFGMMRPNDWGLGFELRDAKQPHWTGTRNSPRTFGHFGGSGSFLWVDPDAEVALAALADLDFGPWAVEAWPELSDAVLEALGR